MPLTTSYLKMTQVMTLYILPRAAGRWIPVLSLSNSWKKCGMNEDKADLLVG